MERLESPIAQPSIKQCQHHRAAVYQVHKDSALLRPKLATLFIFSAIPEHYGIINLKHQMENIILKMANVNANGGKHPLVTCIIPVVIFTMLKVKKKTSNNLISQGKTQILNWSNRTSFWDTVIDPVSPTPKKPVMHLYFISFISPWDNCGIYWVLIIYCVVVVGTEVKWATEELRCHR